MEKKILGSANAVVSRQVKRENRSLPVAVRVSKTYMLKLPIDEIFHAMATSPERPVVSVVFVTGHVAIEMNKFHGGYFTTQWNVKRAILGISRTKTHW